MKFRKKPVVIDAVQWNGPQDLDAIVSFIHETPQHRCRFSLREGGFFVETMEGEMRASPGDWIIRGVKGEYYPCKPDIFAATYEPADEALKETP